MFFSDERLPHQLLKPVALAYAIGVQRHDVVQLVGHAARVRGVAHGSCVDFVKKGLEISGLKLHSHRFSDGS